MAKVSTLAKLAKTVATNGKDVTALIEAAGVVVAAANTLLKEAKPILDTVDTEAIAQKTKASMRVMSENAKSGMHSAAETAKTGVQAAAEKTGKAGEAAKGAAGEAADTVAGIFTKLGETKESIFNDLAKSKSEKELRNAIKDARQTVLENATTAITVADYAKAKEKAAEGAVGTIGPISDMPGCFVIATYRKMDFDRDLTDYTGIYVGRADDAAQGVELALSREGNADVYADVKFKQNVHIYVFNCMPDVLDERYLSLLQTFADERSYN